MSTWQHPGLPLAAAKRNRSTENRSIVNTNRPTKWRRANAGRDLPKKRARGTRRIGRESTRSPWSERYGGVDEGGDGPLPPPVELGQRIHRHRAGAPRYRSRRPRAAHAISASVENGQGSQHRLQSRGPAGQLLPGAEHWACAAASPALHKLPVPAANPRNRRSEDLGSRQQREGSRGSYRLPARHLPWAPLLAPLPPDLPGSGGVGAGDDLPSVGERHRQLPQVGRGPRGGGGRRG